MKFLRVKFDRRLKLEYHGSRITLDAGLLAYRELDNALRLSDLAGGALSDGRRGKNIRHLLTELLFAVGRDRGPWLQHAELAQDLLGDDPSAIIGALEAAVSDGASFADLGRSLCYAAALRVARFGTANEHGDWETAHHVFTYCSAVHQGLKRIGSDLDHGGHFVEPVRAILHGAIAIYVIRYLNVPPARLPGEGDERLEDLPSTVEDIVDSGAKCNGSKRSGFGRLCQAL